MNTPPNQIFPMRRANAPRPDNRHVYGVGCSWNGPIANVAMRGMLPACPHCGGVLYEMDADKWGVNVQTHSFRTKDAGYPKFIKWLADRGTCSPLHSQADLIALRVIFDNEQANFSAAPKP